MASFSRQKMISVRLRGSVFRTRWTLSWKMAHPRWSCRESERIRLDEGFLLFEESAEGLHRDVRECCCESSVLGRKVQVVNSVHPRNEALVHGPLVREAYLDHFQLLQIQLGLGESDQHSFESALPVDAVQHALMSPDLHYPLSGRDLDRHVKLQLARAEVKDEIGGQRGALILDGQHFDPVSGLDAERQCQQMTNQQFEVGARRLLVLIGG